MEPTLRPNPHLAFLKMAYEKANDGVGTQGQVHTLNESSATNPHLAFQLKRHATAASVSSAAVAPLSHPKPIVMGAAGAQPRHKKKSTIERAREAVRRGDALRLGSVALSVSEARAPASTAAEGLSPIDIEAANRVADDPLDSTRKSQLGWLARAERLVRVWSGERMVLGRSGSSSGSSRSVLGRSRSSSRASSADNLPTLTDGTLASQNVGDVLGRGAIRSAQKWLRRAERLARSPLPGSPRSPRSPAEPDSPVPDRT